MYSISSWSLLEFLHHSCGYFSARGTVPPQINRHNLFFLNGVRAAGVRRDGEGGVCVCVEGVVVGGGGGGKESLG